MCYDKVRTTYQHTQNIVHPQFWKCLPLNLDNTHWLDPWNLIYEKIWLRNRRLDLMFWAQVIYFSIFIRNLYNKVLGISQERKNSNLFLTFHLNLYLYHLPPLEILQRGTSMVCGRINLYSSPLAKFHRNLTHISDPDLET